MLYLIRFLELLLSPLIFLYMFYRYVFGKEERGHFRERFALGKFQRPEGKLIWFNAVSVGEINSAWSLVEKINEKTDYSILITTTTVTATQNVRNRIETLNRQDRVQHCYAPIDMCGVIGRFLRHWKPDLLVNVESEFWPNLFFETSKKCPIIVLNGKLSEKSFSCWNRHRSIANLIFPKITLCLAQSEADLERFKKLGVAHASHLVNTKFFVNRCAVDENLREKLLAKIKNRHSWLVNCTHRGEEEIIVETHRKLKQKYADIFTFLVLRHPHRVQQVESILDNYGIRYQTSSAIRSGINGDEKYPGEDGVEFHIHDELGGLGTFFEMCPLVFLGGSLVENVGGHNPLEAIQHNCCVLTGPHVDNNRNLFDELEKISGCLILKEASAQCLSGTLVELFENPDEVNTIIANAGKIRKSYAAAADDIFDIIVAQVK